MVVGRVVCTGLCDEEEDEDLYAARGDSLQCVWL